MNTYADWQADDITVSGSYTLTPLRGTTYDGYVASDMVTDGLNQLVAAEEEEAQTYTTAGFITSGSYITTTTHASITHVSSSALNIEIPFYAAGLTVTSVSAFTTIAYTVPVTNYAISVADNTFILYGTTSACWIRQSGVGTKAMTITLSNNSTYTFNLIQQ